MGPEATALEIRDRIRRGELSVVEVCRAVLDRIEALDARLGAFNTVVRAQALARAAALDRERPRAVELPLFGLPIAVKDNICTRGVRTTASSRILANFVPPYDATVVERLERAGAVIVGKTNCDEFAMGSSNENSAFRPARNPWALDRIPGGSSGGSAVAVAARLTPLALGSDTGGSVRQPAALCGIVGLKPTYGRVSRYGLIAFASSLEQIGPLALTVRDAALVLEVIAGADPRDSTAAHREPPQLLAALTGHLAGARLGVPRRLLEQGVDEGVTRAVDAALAVFARQGARLVDIDLPHAEYAIPVYYLVATAEASSNLARYDGVRYGVRAPLDRDATLAAMYDRTRDLGFGPEVKRRIMLGTYVLSAGYYDAYYLQAQKVRTLIRRDYEAAFAAVDAVVMPTSPTPAFRLGERLDDPLQMYLADVFTVSANLAGLPAISVPCGFVEVPAAATDAPHAAAPASAPTGPSPGEGTVRLPVGLQLIGRPFDEATLCRLADAYERETAWWTIPPPVAGG